MSGAACPEGVACPEGAGPPGLGAGAGLDEPGCDGERPLPVAGDCGRNRYAPRPARTSTTTAKAASRWNGDSSMPISYFRRQIGRLQNGPAGSSDPPDPRP